MNWNIWLNKIQIEWSAQIKKIGLNHETKSNRKIGSNKNMVKNFVNSGPFYTRARVPQPEGRVPYPYVNTPKLKDNGKTAGYRSIAKCDTASQHITVQYLLSLWNDIVAS